MQQKPPQLMTNDSCYTMKQQQKFSGTSIAERIGAAEPSDQTARYLEGLKMECLAKENALRTAQTIIHNYRQDNQELKQRNSFLHLSLQRLQNRCDLLEDSQKSLFSLQKQIEQLKQKYSMLNQQCQTKQLYISSLKTQLLLYQSRQKQSLKTKTRREPSSYSASKCVTPQTQTKKLKYGTPLKHSQRKNDHKYDREAESETPLDRSLLDKLSEKVAEIQLLKERLRRIQGQYQIVIKQLKPRRSLNWQTPSKKG